MSLSPDELLDELLARGVSLDDLLEAVERRGVAGSPAFSAAAEADDATRVVHHEAALPPPNALETVSERYRREGLLGSGGMGEVHLVQDESLGRRVALKTLHDVALQYPKLVRRFRDEALVTAQLQHPGIIPVYDMGEFSSGRLWFTMKQVRGKTLKMLIRAVHQVSRKRWNSTDDGWSLRRLVGVLHRVCETLAYAHERGVVHRDLKPSNIMVGAHGEVFVLDWGIAKVLGSAAAPSGPIEPTVVLPDAYSSAEQTEVGSVEGTPAYMAPEQAEGRSDELGPHTDLYAIGAILYEILSGHPPYGGHSGTEVLRQVLAGPPPPMATQAALETHLSQSLDDLTDTVLAPQRVLPTVLVATAERAMQRAPRDRFESADALATALASWLDGTERRAEALRIVETARDRVPQALTLRAKADRTRRQAAEVLAAIEPWRPVADKVPAWRQQAHADDLSREAERLELETDLLLHGALNRSPELPEAHAMLADRYRARHGATEAAGENTLRLEGLLRRHVLALPRDHPDRSDHIDYLQGDGLFSLVTEPPGVTVTLFRYKEQDRKLVPTEPRALGKTPLRGVRVPMGSYLCRLTHPDGTTTPYPVHLRREEHWDGVAPDESEPTVIRVPARGEIGEDERLVLGGWFTAGGSGNGPVGQPVRVWVDDVVVRTHPVTNAEYIRFLNDLVGQGRTEEALRHAPRTAPGALGVPGALLVGFEDRRFFLGADAEGDRWAPDWPVVSVDWYGAQAFARWETARTGLPWRLLAEAEWEKAARGVDGRDYPMGAYLDPSWACVFSSHADRPLPAPVEAYPDDESPYGVRGCAGNSVDWCADLWDPTPMSARPGPPRVVAPSSWSAPLTPEVHAVRAMRGGNWSLANSRRAKKIASRLFAPAHDRWNFVGLRIGRSR